MTNTIESACNCGQWSGTACEGTLGADAVTVEFVPESIRATHMAAGNRGTYPHNGAVRILVTPECASQMLDDDGQWCVIVGGEGAPETFTWRTDGASGEIEATDIEQAIEQLVADGEWPTPAQIRDGGWGWVEGPDGERQHVGQVP